MKEGSVIAAQKVAQKFGLKTPHNATEQRNTKMVFSLRAGDTTFGSLIAATCQPLW
jgi:hypothetical protein